MSLLYLSSGGKKTPSLYSETVLQQMLTDEGELAGVSVLINAGPWTWRGWHGFCQEAGRCVEPHVCTDSSEMKRRWASSGDGARCGTSALRLIHTFLMKGFIITSRVVPFPDVLEHNRRGQPESYMWLTVILIRMMITQAEIIFTIITEGCDWGFFFISGSFIFFI